MDYLYISIAVILIGCQFNLNKLFQKKYPNTISIMTLYTAGLGLFAGLFFLFLNGCRLQFSTFSLLLSLAMGVIITINHILAVIIMRFGKVSVYSTFMMLGGMMIPFAVGVIYLNETLSPARIAGFVILIVSLIIPIVSGSVGKQKNKKSPAFILLCLLAFAMNGLASTISKLHQINENAVDTNSYLVFTYTLSFVLSLIAFGIIKLKQAVAPKIDVKEVNEIEEPKNHISLPQNKNNKAKYVTIGVLITALTSVVAGVGYLLQLWGAKTLDASVLYPMVTGGSIVISTIIGRIAYKEKITLPIWIGIALTLCGTILFLF